MEAEFQDEMEDPREEMVESHIHISRLGNLESWWQKFNQSKDRRSMFHLEDRQAERANSFSLPFRMVTGNESPRGWAVGRIAPYKSGEVIESDDKGGDREPVSEAWLNITCSSLSSLNVPRFCCFWDLHMQFLFGILFLLFLLFPCLENSIHSSSLDVTFSCRPVLTFPI